MAEHMDSSQLSPFELPTSEIEALLRSGDDPRLRSYFGDESYEELRELVRQPPAPVRRGGPMVLILPGILGSTIGLKGRVFNDTIWFDPVSLIRGDATKMALTARQRCEALDIIPVLYMLLRLRLRLHGFKVRDHYYDWRKSLDDLGRELANRIDEESATEVYLVAHSMGGLVARAALAANVSKVKRLVMLGTPNRGSFAAVQVLRAVNGTVQLVAKLDLENDPDQLVNRVFNTFPSVYQMLPVPEVYDRVDLYDASSWPSVGPKIRKPILSATRSVQEELAPGDERFHLIAGIGRETVTDLSVASDGRFVYHTTNNGDETVPTIMAELPGIEDRTRYVNETHNGLVKNKEVAKAVCQILDSGRTDLLDARPSSRRGEAASRTLGEADFLAADPYAGRRGQGLLEREQASALEHAFSTLPPQISRGAAVPRGTSSPKGPASVSPCDPEYSPLTGVVVSRRTQHRLDVELTHGSLFDVPARAYVMGIFQGVAPSGPATFVDTATQGALSEFVARNLISGGMGQVFMMPTGCHPLRSDVILIAGLGEFDRFQGSYESALRLVSENVVRTLINSGIDELATVMLGGGSGTDIPRLLDAMFAGFANGLNNAKGEMRFRRVVLCETNLERYQEIKRHLYWRAASPEFANVELTLDEICYKSPVESEARRDSLLPTEEEQSTILFTRLSTEKDSPTAVLRATVLTAGGKATVVPSALEIDESELDKLLDRLDDIRKVDMKEFGTELAQFLFTPEFVELLDREEIGGSHIRIINDLQASRIPWETLCFGGKFPSLVAGVSRLLEARPDSIAKWVEARRVGETLEILLIVNPTGDLPGAASEGDAIARAIRAIPGTRLTVLREKEATQARVLEHFQSGEFDVVHYAGHAFFDPDDRGRSGIRCHDKVLAGKDLAMLDRLPTLVFLNACEAGRVRGAKVPSTRDRIEKSVGIAEALLRAGIAQFVGTYWPVGDAAAEHFAKSFYKDVINAEPMGSAVVNARRHVSEETKSVDWADYIHYGDSRFRLKQPQ